MFSFTDSNTMLVTVRPKVPLGIVSSLLALPEPLITTVTLLERKVRDLSLSPRILNWSKTIRLRSERSNLVKTPGSMSSKLHILNKSLVTPLSMTSLLTDRYAGEFSDSARF